MKIKFFLLILLLCIPLIVNAKDRPTNELPMYGGKHNPTVEQNKAYSASAAKLAWQYYYRGDLDTAIKRFNQSWMFDRESIDALWGFGLIMGRRASEEMPEYHLKESIRFLDMAFKKAPTNARLIVDLALSQTLFAAYLKDKSDVSAQQEFLKAVSLFETAAEHDNNYPLLHANWSVLEFYMGNYLKAKESLEQAKKLGYQPNPAYVKDLDTKLNKKRTNQ